MKQPLFDLRLGESGELPRLLVVATKVPIDPFEKDMTKHLDTFKERLVQNVHVVMGAQGTFEHTAWKAQDTDGVQSSVRPMLHRTCRCPVLDLSGEENGNREKHPSLQRFCLFSATLRTKHILLMLHWSLQLFRMRNGKRNVLYARGLPNNQMVITLKDRMNMLCDHADRGEWRQARYIMKGIWRRRQLRLPLGRRMWNQMIKAHVNANRPKAAESWLKDMLNRVFQPDIYSRLLHSAPPV
ncbi:unnamed protein product [Symbiodinium natans]|uniref:Uncharacterized protein n=1 Tax=Symbiodinium natans TaxID=878477 RepID=A0A812N1T1_9DINO|nr:unnamed protein product [Symbiodinium natans]